MKPSYVYVITNLVNGKQYVGKSNDPEDRFKAHLTGRSRTRHLHLSRAISKYGKDKFVLEIISQHPTEDDAFTAEHMLILEKQAAGVELYNANTGGKGGFRLSEEVKAKISKSHTGKTLSPETKQKLSAAAKKQFADPTQRENISVRNKERWKTMSPSERSWRLERLHSNPRDYGSNPMSADTKRKISETLIAYYDKVGRPSQEIVTFTYPCPDCGVEITKTKKKNHDPKNNGLGKRCRSCNVKAGHRARKAKASLCD
jgi:group I intron endonuclease